MTVKTLENNLIFSDLIEDVKNQWRKFPELTKLEVADKFFSERHEVAIRFYRLHQEVMNGGFSNWRKSGGMKEDFELLFEWIEKGYAQGIQGFDSLLDIFEFIRNLGSPDQICLTITEKITCPDCDGDGGTYVYGKCTYCNGTGTVHEKVKIEGEGEEKYCEALDFFNEDYQKQNEKSRFDSYTEFIQRYEESEVNIVEELQSRIKAKKPKPYCELSKQDGNVFNLMAIVNRTLENHHMIEEAKEMIERVFASKSYDEALRIFMDYVDVH